VIPTAASTTPPDPAADADYRRARERLAANDLAGASHWLEQAASKRHPAALTELAILHLHGFGRDADPARAVELLLHAEASGGTPETGYLLAQVAIGGVVLPRDGRRIDGWIADSARRGHPAALRVAGLAFGRRPEAAFQRAAAECFRRATEARDPVGAALFADRLHAGRGVARDAALALDYANELRAMGIPVELPAGETDAPPAPGDGALPWDAIDVLGGTLPPADRVCSEPEVATCDGLLDDEECRYLVYSGARFVERSLVVHPKTGQPLEYGVRTSKDMAFAPTDDDAGVRLLEHRMARLAGFTLDHCEPLTLLRYGPGEQYHPHRDYFFPSAPQLSQPGGQRHSTVCVYLNEVAEGGQTVFPDKGVSVQPRRGRAVMFRSLRADGSPEPSSLHAGMPVLAGEKWLATAWIRVNRLRTF